MHILNLNVGQMEYIIIAIKKGLRDILKSIISATNCLYLFYFKVDVYKRFVNVEFWQYALTTVDLQYLDKDISKTVKKESERPISTLSELRPKDEVVTSYNPIKRVEFIEKKCNFFLFPFNSENSNKITSWIYRLR